MQSIRVIDRNFNLLSEIDDYESFSWVRRWSRPGEFELHININKNNTGTLQKENLILYKGMAGIIRYREMGLDENGKGGETLKIKGSALSILMNRRITVPPEGLAYDVINDKAETVMKHYVEVECTRPVDSSRVIPSLEIAEDQGRGGKLKYQSRLKQLDEELEKLSGISGLGWDILPDLRNKKYIFDVSEGRDLTTSQTTNNPVIFGVDFDNIKGQTYIDSDLEYRNQAYIGGQGEGEERSIVEIGEQRTGLDRIEVFIDARDLSEDDDLPERGRQKLLEMARLESFESKILPKEAFEYGQDWDLGDIVTVTNPKWGITMDSRITEIKEVYEPAGFQLEATFGNTMPTLVSTIKKALDMPIIEQSK